MDKSGVERLARIEEQLTNLKETLPVLVRDAILPQLQVCRAEHDERLSALEAKGAQRNGRLDILQATQKGLTGKVNQWLVILAIAVVAGSAGGNVDVMGLAEKLIK